MFRTKMQIMIKNRTLKYAFTMIAWLSDKKSIFVSFCFCIRLRCQIWTGQATKRNEFLSKAVWNFSENSSVLVALPVPYHYQNQPNKRDLTTARHLFGKAILVPSNHKWIFPAIIFLPQNSY